MDCAAGVLWLPFGRQSPFPEIAPAIAMLCEVFAALVTVIVHALPLVVSANTRPLPVDADAAPFCEAVLCIAAVSMTCPALPEVRCREFTAKYPAPMTTITRSTTRAALYFGLFQKFMLFIGPALVSARDVSLVMP